MGLHSYEETCSPTLKFNVITSFQVIANVK